MHLRSSAALVAAVFLSLSQAFADTKPVTIAAPWEVASYDVAVSGFAIQKLEILENLVDADENGVLEPGLATEWAASDDGLTWTFTLRKAVKFHDGTDFDAASAALALRRAWQQPGILEKAPITAIEAGDGTVIFSLSTPFAALPSLLAHATTIIPAPASFDTDGKPVALIGTGPFAVEKFTPPQSISVTRFEGYWGDAPEIETASYLAAGRAETRALLAESGDADIVFSLDPAGFSRLSAVDTVKTTAVPIPRVVTLKVNAAHPFLDDPRARQALSLAMNRKGIATAITRFPESVASQLFPPALNMWHNTSLSPLKHDVEAAKALLAELGWAAGEDGILVKDGDRFAVTLRTFPDRPELPLIAAALQDMWREIGIELTVDVNNYSMIPQGHQDGSLHLALYARNYGLTPDPVGTVLQDFGSAGGDWGAMGWDRPDVAEALARVAATDDEAARAADIALVTKAIQDELPLIPVVWYQHTVSVAQDLENVIIDPLQRSYGLSEMNWAK